MSNKYNIDTSHEHKTGCPPRAKNLLDERFGKLLVVEFMGMRDNRSIWRCVCDCGNEVQHPASRLPSKKSCGCLSQENWLSTEKVETHGMSGTRVYSIWGAMKDRATNLNAPRAEDYILRGIDVDESWLEFENFYADMGDPPSENHSLDRIKNHLGYSLENCKWSTPSEQQSNRRISNNTSGRIGVSYCKQTGKWKVRLNCNKLNIWLGRHESFDVACDVIEGAELEYLGYSRKEGFIK